MTEYDMTYAAFGAADGTRDESAIVTTFEADTDLKARDKGRVYSITRPDGEGHYFLWNLSTTPPTKVIDYSQGKDTTDPNSVSENYDKLHPDEDNVVAKWYRVLKDDVQVGEATQDLSGQKDAADLVYKDAPLSTVTVVDESNNVLYTLTAGPNNWLLDNWYIVVGLILVILAVVLFYYYKVM